MCFANNIDSPDPAPAPPEQTPAPTDTAVVKTMPVVNRKKGVTLSSMRSDLRLPVNDASASKSSLSLPV